MATLQANLQEGFMSFLTSPISGPGSPVRAYGTDFYEYPHVPITPPPHYDTDRQSLNATCVLYDSSYSVRSVKSAATGPGSGSQTGAGTHESLSSLGKSERKKLERELELARVAEEMHQWGMSPPDWTTFHKVDSVTACAQPIVTKPRVEADHSNELRDSEATKVTDETDLSELTGVIYGNGMDRPKLDWRWESSSGVLLRMFERGPTVTVEEVSAGE